VPQGAPALAVRGAAGASVHPAGGGIQIAVRFIRMTTHRIILVVDDEPDLVANCERLLKRIGHASLRAHTGPDAIAMIDRERPDLVVADLRLPGVDGLAVTRHARRHVPPIPVILITAYDSPQTRRAATDSGAEVYLAKPFTNAAFLDAVARVLSPQATDADGDGGG
jgi:CheY-like chemotaxis protein